MTEEPSGERPALLQFADRLQQNGATAGRRIARVWAARPGLPKRVGIAAVLGAFLVVATALRLDAASQYWVATLHAGPVAFFRFATRFGKSDWLLIPSGLAVILLLFGAWRRIDRRVAAAWAEIGALFAGFFVAVAGSGIAVDIIKSIIGRERPVLFGTDGPFAFVPFSIGFETNGFPSGHATTMGAVVVFVAALSPGLAAPVAVLGLIVAVSRVAVQAHYPSDVVAGFLFGAAYAYLVVLSLAAARVGFGRAAAGRPRPRIPALCRLVRRRGIGPLFAGLWSALKFA